jgi:hypothetical protein
MSKDFKVGRNKEEYLFLREEIMLRTEWHLGFTKNAITMSVSIWGGVFALIAYSLDKVNNFDTVLYISKFILLFPILIMYSLSNKIHENYINFCNIGAYLIKFHEKPVSENDGNFFSWETAHADLLTNFRVNKPTIIKTMNKSNNELSFLSIISLLLFLFFSALNIKYYCSTHAFITSIAATIIGILFMVIIHRKSSYECLGELSKAAQEFWGSYPKEEGNLNSSTTNQKEVLYEST